MGVLELFKYLTKESICNIITKITDKDI